jgi:hypothetical protein
VTTLIIPTKQQAWTTEAALMLADPVIDERVLVWALDTERAWLGDGSTNVSGLTAVIDPSGGGGTWGSITGTLSDQTDLDTALAGKLPTTYLDTDGTLAANSDTKIASQKAVKTYVGTAVTGLLDFKGATDCSANPNYPAASKGDAYVVSVAGKIGGASGKSVDVGDMYLATADNAGGTEASVGTSWAALEHNLLGALLAANNLSDLADPTTSRWNIKDPVQTRCRAVATTNQTLSGTTTIDGVALAATNRVLLVGQTAAAENGPWQVQAGAWTRPADFPSGGVIQAYLCLVAGGTSYSGSVWGMTHTGNLTIDSGAQTWVLVNTTAPAALANKNLTSGTNTFPNFPESQITGLVADLAAKAPLASPAFTGSPTAPTQSAGDNSTKLATTAYVDALIAAADALVYKGVVDCSANPNYPAADAGWTYRVSVAGKIGGASGVNVEVGDLLLCLTDGTASGNQATVGANWDIVQANIDGAVVGPASATSGNVATYNGTSGKTIQDGGKALPSGAIVGTTDAQTVTNKTFSATNTFPTFNQTTTGNAGGITGKTTPSGDLVGTTDTQTLTGKRKQPRVNAQASTATLTPEIDTYDVFRLTAQAAGLTIANHSTSTPADGEQMRISILDNGTARAISFGTNYVARGGVALPTTTVISKLMTLGFEWYAHLSKWVLLANTSEL